MIPFEDFTDKYKDDEYDVVDEDDEDDEDD